MGLRGPKPVDMERLKWHAAQWAVLLHALRDGRHARVYKVRWFEHPLPTGRWIPGEVLYAEIVPLKRRGAEKLLKSVQKALNANWWLSPPIFPNAKAWERLKCARTVEEIKSFAENIHKWARRARVMGLWTEEYPRTIRNHDSELLRAKRMPNYPRRSWPGSDNKRMQFFAKVLAGLTLGIAPATATKRLGHWRWPESTEKTREEFVRKQLEESARERLLTREKH